MGKGNASRWGSVAALAVAALFALGAGCGDDPAAAKPGTGDPPIPDPGVVTSGRPVPGARVAFGTRGPWGEENRVYGGASGVREGWIVGITTDEAQNRWIATTSALYLATPGGGLWRFDEMDGLHLGEVTGRTPGPIGWVQYCDNVPVADGAACSSDRIWGGGNAAGIRSIVGGGPNEVFVGYQGSHTRGLSCPTDWPDGCDPLRHSGRIDRVKLNPDGSIRVDRLEWFLNWSRLDYWYNRSAYRLAYDHFAHPGALYAGSDHGVIILFPNDYTPYTGVGPGGLDAWLAGWAGDHNHAIVCVASGGNPCDHTTAGHWRGLWINSAGQLWMAGESTAGLANFRDDPVAWYSGGGHFEWAFANPYGNPGSQNEPVFKVPTPGAPVNLTAVSTCPDGRTWFASEGATGVAETVAVWDPVAKSFRTFGARSFGLPDSPVEDLVCLPDGRVVIAGRPSGIVIHDPKTGTSAPLEGLPSDRVTRLAVDAMVTPPALLVGTDSGAAVLRQIP